jgi:hypothetical protein
MGFAWRRDFVQCESPKEKPGSKAGLFHFFG